MKNKLTEIFGIVGEAIVIFGLPTIKILIFVFCIHGLYKFIQSIF